MKREDFVKQMNAIKQLSDDIDFAHSALKRLDPDFGGLFISRATQIPLDTLALAMDDRSQWISYFVYDLEWGKKWHKDSIKNNGASVRLKTPTDLYRLLKSNL